MYKPSNDSAWSYGTEGFIQAKPDLISDYIKLAKEMKLILHKLVHVGMNSPRTFGILVEGMSKFYL